MFKLLSLVVCCVVAVPATPAPGEKRLYDLQQADTLFEEFAKTHQRQYRDEHERQIRLQIFKTTLERLNSRNMKSKTATFGINQFSDMTIEELKQKYTGLSLGVHYEDCDISTTNSSDPVPDEFDWRQQQKVTRVKDQKRCGSCWAFSVTGNLEGQYAIKHNELKEFSEQQLVDCDEKDNGCNGGLMKQAYLWLKNNGGIESESDYPYVADDCKCNFDESKVVAKVSGCTEFNVDDEDSLKQILVSTGPLSIAVDCFAFFDYNGGILDDCEDSFTNHGVLLVGYGKENGTPYWIVKNSWSESFGESGYIRLKMYENCCNLIFSVTSGVVE